MTIEDIIEKCKCGVYLTVNRHRDYYETAEQFISDDVNSGLFIDVPEDEKQRMIDTNTIVELQFYPNTPIGSYCVLAASMSKVLRLAEECFKDD